MLLLLLLLLLLLRLLRRLLRLCVRGRLGSGRHGICRLQRRVGLREGLRRLWKLPLIPSSLVRLLRWLQWRCL